MSLMSAMSYLAFLFIGVVIGVSIMCLVSINREEDDYRDYR